VSARAGARRAQSAAATAALAPGSTAPVLFAAVDHALGRWTVACTARGVAFLALDPDGARAALEAWRRRREPAAALVEDAAALAPVTAALAAYARGERDVALPALDLRGSAFELAVWRELGRIPYGATRTYGEVAARLGRPGAARAVGHANARNPVPVLVPCHRVVAAGGLGGFSGGLDRKRALLALEGALLLR